ncbi:MAG: adenylyl-sulfate kinase [Geobacteraceae bacterium]|nr:adenylyl-sulfate kinase [Geobacteraceae bacterium]
MNRTVVWHAGQVTGEERALLLKQQPATLWLTGLSGAGKSTIACALERRLLDGGHAAYVLDGDNVRHGLNRDLGFSPGDRTENIRRIAEVARLLNDAGLIVVTAFISPYREDREMARSIIGEDAFLEVHVNTPIQVCEERDPKGFYKLARTGELPAFTGVSAPYEPPLEPLCSIDTARCSVDECVDRLMGFLEPFLKAIHA